MQIIENQNHAQSAIDQLKMMQAIGCVVDPKSAIYISGPITTGKNFINWYMLHGASLGSDKLAYQSRLRADVIKQNEMAILDLATRVKKETNSYVIQPASLFVPEWGQLEYISFWMKIIEQFASEVVLVDGWQYSIGCVTEYCFARENGIPIRSCNGVVLNPQQGRELLIDAVDEVERLAGQDTILNTLASGLREAVTEK